jgi:hypothetical protein
MRRFVWMLVLVATALAAPRAQGNLHAPFDRILDRYVRDGLVYYRALQSDRVLLDRYIATLDVDPATIAGWPAAEQKAFWLNAYNALVLETVISHYPIKTKSPEYPDGSIRQIPGSFEQLTHRVGGRTMTLDAIEKGPVAGFGDARMFVALGRGALGSGRLKSEVYQAGRIDVQLDAALVEFVTRPTCLKVDRDRQVVEVSPLFGWREAAFIASFASSGSRWATRSPIEQAILGMAFPHLFTSEREILSQDVFQVKYGTFDWHLNDLGSPTSEVDFTKIDKSTSEVIFGGHHGPDTHR